MKNKLVAGLSLCLLPLLLCSQQLHLPSSSNWLNLGDLDISGNNITLEALIYMEAEPIVAYKFDILSKHENTDNVNYFFRHNNFGITTYDHGTSGAVTFYNLYIDYEFELFRLYHVAATYDGTMMRYYVNGCLLNSLPASGNLFQNSFPTGLGQRWIIEDEQFIGYLDEVRIWNTTRSEAEIAANMGGITNPTNANGLVAYYTFENDFVNQANPGVYDGSPEGNPLLTSNSEFSIPLLESPTLFVDPGSCTNPTGTISIEAIPGVEYSFNGGPFSTVNSWDNLSSGSYSIEASAIDWCTPNYLTTNILTINENIAQSIELNLCPGDSLLIDNQWIYEPGIYEQIVPGAGDCDTLFTYIINQPSADFFEDTYSFCNAELAEIVGPATQTSWSDGSIGNSFFATISGEYLATWEDDLGCTLSENFAVIIEDRGASKHYIPNVFSPNNDGSNDRFSIFFANEQPPEQYDLQIFDRWGGLVFTSNDPSQSWGGTISGKEAAIGTYIYLVRFTFQGCEQPIVVEDAGALTLLR